MAKIDFDAAREIAMQTLESWCPGAAGKTPDARGELIIKSPLRNDRIPGSFSINIKTGVFSDFADPDSKGDAVTLYAKVHGIDLSTAARTLLGAEPQAEQYNIEAMRTAAKGTGAEPENIFSNGKNIPITKKWIYTDGKTTLMVARADTETGKEIRPFHLEDGQWKSGKGQKPENGWPLLYLDRILSNPESTIVIVEGEKAADAIPEPYIGTTWSGGAKASGDTNLEPLTGRKVILWQDKDIPGAEAMDAIQGRIIKKVKTLARVEPAPYWENKTDAADLEDAEKIDTLLAAKTLARPPAAFPLVAVDDMTLKPPRWIIKGILEADCFASFFGASAAGKSFLTLSIAAHIAARKDFCGCTIKKSGPIIYIAGEGFNGLKRRLVAWELFHETKIPPKKLFISKTAAELGDKKAMENVAEAIKEIADEYGAPALIIVDTWARSLTGDENSSADVNAAIRDLDALRGEYDASCIVVHHTGKGDQTQARGSSALRGALDAEYHIANDDGILVMSNKKMKDGDPIDPISFAFQSVDLGILDDDGETVFSSVVTPANIDLSQNNEIDNGKRTGQALETIRDAGGNMKIRLFHEVMKEKGISQKTVKRIKDQLSAAGRIRITSNEISIVRTPEC